MTEKNLGLHSDIKNDTRKLLNMKPAMLFN